MDGVHGTYIAHSNINFDISSNIGKTLDTTVKNWLGLTDDELIETTWYQSNGIYDYEKYTVALEETNGVKARVGLIRAGEMLSDVTSTMLTNNYTSSYANEAGDNYWTMTHIKDENGKVDTSYVTIVSRYGGLGSAQIAAKHYLRPVIVISSDSQIVTGTGLWNNPYQI